GRVMQLRRGGLCEIDWVMSGPALDGYRRYVRRGEDRGKHQGHPPPPHQAHTQHHHHGNGHFLHQVERGCWNAAVVSLLVPLLPTPDHDAIPGSSGLTTPRRLTQTMCRTTSPVTM